MSTVITREEEIRIQQNDSCRAVIPSGRHMTMSPVSMLEQVGSTSNRSRSRSWSARVSSSHTHACKEKATSDNVYRSTQTALAV